MMDSREIEEFAIKVDELANNYCILDANFDEVMSNIDKLFNEYIKKEKDVTNLKKILDNFIFESFKNEENISKLCKINVDEIEKYTKYDDNDNHYVRHRNFEKIFDDICQNKIIFYYDIWSSIYMKHKYQHIMDYNTFQINYANRIIFLHELLKSTNIYTSFLNYLDPNIVTTKDIEKTGIIDKLSDVIKYIISEFSKEYNLV